MHTCGKFLEGSEERVMANWANGKKKGGSNKRSKVEGE
jgi:hypothetical protein